MPTSRTDGLDTTHVARVIGSLISSVLFFILGTALATDLAIHTPRFFWTSACIIGFLGSYALSSLLAWCSRRQRSRAESSDA